MVFAILLVLLAAAIAWAVVTNPFSRFSVIKQTYVAEFTEEAFTAINENHKLRIRQSWPWRTFSFYVKSFVHIASTRYVASPGSSAKTVDGIIADIHAHRFRPEKLLLTSGDHFSSLFVRNLGVFYYPMLDAQVVGVKNGHDWHDRQAVYLQTLAYALGVFDKRPIPVTTIVPTGSRHATCMNYYVYPSDTVYGVLFALAALLGKEKAAPFAYGEKAHTLGTVPAAEILLHEYKATLKALYKDYRTTVFDESTGLIRTDIHLSGAKDITRRTCAFYDNVVFWKTSELAQTLGVADKKINLKALKQTILDTFWLEDEGYFLEDLSTEGIDAKYYSSDWLIVLTTGFLDPADPNEQKYFARNVEYIQRMGIDKPFAIKYQHETRAHRQFFWARVAFAAYGGDVVWSFWGMEYIKVLLRLYDATGAANYLERANFHLKAYEKAMLRDGGFPEVFDDKGKLYETWIYRSIRQTGWVIGFEQARAMRDAVGAKQSAHTKPKPAGKPKATPKTLGAKKARKASR
ncbi:MAG TPA: hypothetical protein VIM53_00310 [Candidatus Saccharimonadales bacterium]